jgi:outer membrane lipoprotein-sorting protein
MVAKEDAAVVWGHQIWWIDKNDMLVLKAELYDEDGYLVRTETGSEIREMDGRLIPSRLELLPVEEKDNKTIVEIKEIRFNMPVNENFFSQQNMKTIR